MAEKQKNRKQGRTKKSGQNARYINEGRHNKSHIRRITKHLARYGDKDRTATQALQNYKIKAGVLSTRPQST